VIQKGVISKVGNSKRGNVRAKRVISKVLDFQFGQNKSAQLQLQNGMCRLGIVVASWPDMCMTGHVHDASLRHACNVRVALPKQPFLHQLAGS
jgi:hypothetical protein